MNKSFNGTAYEIRGHEDAPVVVLIHGIGLNRMLWRDYEAALLQEGYRVLSYDLYGHGDSARPLEKLSLTVFANQLRELIDELNINRCVIVGFSLGGMINRRFAMDYPERTRALAILNSPHERSPEAQKQVEERVLKTAQGGPAATIQSSLERWFTPEFLSGRNDVVDEIRQWFLANNPDTFTESRQVLASGVIELIRPQPPISCPALVMTCENDTGSTPEMTHGIAAEIVGAQTVIIPQLQHLGLVEKPFLFIKPLIEFLNSDSLLSQR